MPAWYLSQFTISSTTFCAFSLAHCILWRGSYNMFIEVMFIPWHKNVAIRCSSSTDIQACESKAQFFSIPTHLFSSYVYMIQQHLTFFLQRPQFTSSNAIAIVLCSHSDLQSRLLFMVLLKIGYIHLHTPIMFYKG